LIIYYKRKTKLVEKFCEDFETILYTKPTFIKKLSFKKNIQKPQIYFHSGLLTNANLELMAQSLYIVVSSNTIKQEIVEKSNDTINNSKIYVAYHGHTISKFKKKEFKKAFKDKYSLDKKTKLIYFTANNYEKNGLVQFLQFIKQLNFTNYKAVISGTPEQLKSVVPILKEIDIQDKVILEQGDIFRSADIFVLPTQNKSFASNILKAMACQCVVFTPASNHAFELLDNFAIMNNFDDTSTIHKLDMLLSNPKEIKIIQKQNQLKASEYSLDKEYEKLKLALKL
jgi:glycosyltransferase involved in cell wall biosynthesis